MKSVLMIFGLVFLASCASNKPDLIVRQPLPEIQITTPSNPRPIRTEKITIIVYDREALEKALSDPDFRRIIGMTERDYRAIANNYNEAIRFIEAQSSIIEYYENVINELKNRNIIEETAS